MQDRYAGRGPPGRAIEETIAYRLRRRYYERLVERLHLCGDERVLDLGCGGGPATRALARALPRGRVAALDTSPFYLGRARRRLSSLRKVEFIQQDVRTAPIPEGSLDRVLVHRVLHDIPERDRAATMRALAKRMSPKGWLLIVEPTRPGHGITEVEVLRLAEGAGLELLARRDAGRLKLEMLFVRPDAG